MASILSEVMGALNEIKAAIQSNINVGDVISVVRKVDEAAHDVVKTFGQGGDRVVEIKKALVESRIEVQRLGGSFQDIVDIQNNISKTLSRNIILQSDQYPKLFAASQLINQDAGTIAEKFKDAGFSIYQSSDEIKKVLDVARGLGINAESVSSKVLSNIDKMNLFTFQGGVEGLARMASQASLLRIDMGKTFTLAEQLFSPEKAIDLAASLQRLGVTQSSLLDPLKLMDLAQNDPEELQNQIVEMTKSFAKFNETTGKFEIAPGGRRQLREIEEALGYSKGELSKMALGSIELEDKMSKISFPNTFTEEQKQMIANMAEMGPGGEYKLRLNGEDLNIDEAVNKLSGSQEEMTKFLDASKPRTLEELQREQLPYLKQMASDMSTLANRTGFGISTTKSADDALKNTAEYIRKITGEEGLGGVLKDKDISKKFDTIDFNEVLKTLKGAMVNSNQTMEETLNKLKESGGEFTTYVSDELSKSLNILKTELEKTFSEEDLRKMGERLEGLWNNITRIGGGSMTTPPTGSGGTTAPPTGTEGTNTSPSGTGGTNAPPTGTNAPPTGNEGMTPPPNGVTINVNHMHKFENLPGNITQDNLINYLITSLNDVSYNQSLISSVERTIQNYYLTERKT